MDNRVLESGASVTPPPVPAAPSVGYPTKGNPGTGTPASKGGVFWYYQIGEELRNLVSAAGIVPSTADLTQVAQAVEKLIEARVGDFALDTGVANAYVMALNPPIAAYSGDFDFAIKIANAPTGASTINFGGGAVPLVNDQGGAIAANDFVAGTVLRGQYIHADGKAYITSLVATQALSKALADTLYSSRADRVGTGCVHFGTTAPAHTLALPTAATNVSVASYPALAAKLGITWGNGATTAAGAFVVGTQYVIVSIGTTDFTLIGAASNTVGLVFTATGAGAGTGTAATQFGLPIVGADGTLLQANGNVGTTTLGQVMSHNHFIGYWAGGGSSNGWPGAQPTGGQYSGSTGGSQNTAAGSRVLLCIYYE